ncbi:hypothetical protein IHV77_04695 [Rodentibacter haemolyticus]|uniref:Uncharacterized protein n=1 Tax=Rodentibacter haemolyticus TaxID=2778911 RepID=A0ABX6UZG7_9PAST|nr:hypothetical protein [Rodentibacter haemolyticus]QPB43393.1 hypothetical protein IHV77_04695 [Rodentibacter haemolyticus]
MTPKFYTRAYTIICVGSSQGRINFILISLFYFTKFTHYAITHFWVGGFLVKGFEKAFGTVDFMPFGGAELVFFA